MPPAATNTARALFPLTVTDYNYVPRTLSSSQRARFQSPDSPPPLASSPSSPDSASFPEDDEDNTEDIDVKVAEDVNAPVPMHALSAPGPRAPIAVLHQHTDPAILITFSPTLRRAIRHLRIAIDRGMLKREDVTRRLIGDYTEWCALKPPPVSPPSVTRPPAPPFTPSYLVMRLASLVHATFRPLPRRVHPQAYAHIFAPTLARPLALPLSPAFIAMRFALLVRSTFGPTPRRIDPYAFLLAPVSAPVLGKRRRDTDDEGEDELRRAAKRRVAQQPKPAGLSPPSGIVRGLFSALGGTFGIALNTPPGPAPAPALASTYQPAPAPNPIVPYEQGAIHRFVRNPPGMLEVLGAGALSDIDVYATSTHDTDIELAIMDREISELDEELVESLVELLFK